MTAFHVLHELRLKVAGDEVDEFITFMHERYVPALHTGLTRIGQILSLTLTQQDDDPAQAGDHVTFVLDVGRSGLADERLPRLDDEVVGAEFDALVEARFVGGYANSLEWHNIHAL